MTVKIILLAAVARWRVFTSKGDLLHKYLGIPGEETGLERPNKDIEIYISRVSKRISTVTQKLPWESKCLVQAMVAQRLLRKKEISSTLYLGVGRDPQTQDMVAHAWLRSGPYSVTGGTGKGFGVVATFSMGSASHGL